MDYIEAENSYVAEGKDDPKDRIELEVGDSKDPEFHPQIKVMRWDNEVNVSVRLVHDEADPVVSEKDGVVTWEGERQDAHFYELPISDEHPEGAAEFEVVLKEKPDTNVVQFTLNTKGLDFVYQPELTPEEIKQGSIRPDNVVGSYAVFASEDKTNYVGGKEYKSGKVGHIYRPKIIDAKGSEVWGDLNVDTDAGILSVTIPQDFLDNAVYPVTHAAGLTFGYTTLGSSQWGPAVNAALIVKDTPSAGTVQTITLGARNGTSTNGNGKPCIWLVSDGTVLTNSIGSAIQPTSSTGAFYTSSAYSPEPVVAGASYYVGVVVDSDFTGINLKYDTGSAGDGGTAASNSYASPATLGTIGNTSNKFSVYATYTALPFTPFRNPMQQYLAQ